MGALEDAFGREYERTYGQRGGVTHRDLLRLAHPAGTVSAGNPTLEVSAEHRWLFELIKINLSEDVKDRYFTAREIKADLEKRQVTREVSCPKCHHTNKVREPYCARCAEPLTDAAPPCHNCGKPNRMGSRYCIYCGNHLR